MELTRCEAVVRELPSVLKEQARHLRRRIELVPCRRCGTTIDVPKHVARSLHGHASFWEMDTRQVLARCEQCHNCFWVYAYPLFNWVPPMRALNAVAVLDLLVAVLLFSAIH